MPIIEKLGSFFLGREVDPLTGRADASRPVNYDSRDLTTHAVCVGMTGSGKTGLCICLLEEAALDSVPAILIDPKGDIANLLLTFPDLRPGDFRPWIDAEEARRQELTVDAFAGRVAQTWTEGLGAWEQGPERIRALQDAADFAIYTPGSDAGLPVSIVSSFKAPALDWETESETLRDRIQGTVSGLLALVGIEADPIRSREHILLSMILEDAWRGGRDLDIVRLIQAVQNPPFPQIGVFDIDTFYPPKERFELAIALNNIIAAPGFAAWTQGEPLDIPGLLYTPAGKPRHSIFSIAHLSDAERMFFVTLLLEQIISWMRSQPGTTSLRAIVYMDEIFGYFPPVANPPSKKPLLTLLKQARAYGVGLLLATQNPADIDYKGLTNAGTWFIGKLQTERDKARLLDGLTSVLAETAASPLAADLAKTISALRGRTFLLHDVHLPEALVFTTRWAMSYLRGPLTRQQIKTLMAERKRTAPVTPAPTPSPAPPSVGKPASGRLAPAPPVLPPRIRQVFLPRPVSGPRLERSGVDASQRQRQPGVEAAADSVIGVEDRLNPQTRDGVPSASEQGAPRLVYKPALFGFANVRFADRRLGVDVRRDHALLLPLDGDQIIYWKYAQPVSLKPDDLADAPEDDALFEVDLPPAVTEPREFAALTSDLADLLYRSQVFELPWNPTLKLYGWPDEGENAFRIRCHQLAREQRDAAVDALASKYEAPFERVYSKLAARQGALQTTEAEYSDLKRDQLLTGIGSLAGRIGLFSKAQTRRLASQAASQRREAGEARSDIIETKTDISRYQAQIAALQRDVERDAAALTTRWSQAAADLRMIRLTPKRADIDVQMVALAWTPI